MQNLQKHDAPIITSSVCPIYVMDSPGATIPKGAPDIYFTLARGGIYMHKKMGLIHANVKVNDLSFLESISTFANMDLPPIPLEESVKVLNFFRWVQKKFHTEAIVLPYFSQETGEIRMFCPDQKVSSAALEYEDLGSIGEFQCVGSIHSHNDFGAFHSGVDTNDERYRDGLHITFGDLNMDYPTITASLVVSNNRFTVLPEDHLMGVINVGPSCDMNSLPDTYDIDIDDGEEFEDADNPWVSAYILGSYIHTPAINKSPVYDFTYPDGSSAQEGFSFPREWKKKVKRMPVRTYAKTYMPGERSLPGPGCVTIPGTGLPLAVPRY